jgi:hypothetical protein
MTRILAIGAGATLLVAALTLGPSKLAADDIRGAGGTPSFACCTVTCGSQECGACGDLFITCHCSPVDGHAECYGSDQT